MVRRLGQRFAGAAMKPRLDNKTKIEAALDLIRHPTVREVAGPEKFELPCVCAVHDKPYRLRFTRGAGETVWHFLESVKLGTTPGATDAAAVSSASSAGLTVALSDLDTATRPCAWCGDASFHYCHCRAFVCGGRMQHTLKGWLFRCRASCGAEWLANKPLQKVEGTKEQPKRCTTAPPARPAAASVSSVPPQEKPLVFPGKRLLLTAGQQTTGRFDMVRPERKIK